VLTKSIRLTDEEAKDLEAFVRENGEVEAAVLKRAALRGLREDRIDHAILVYLRGEGSERAAAIANLPRARFIDLLAERGVRVLDRPSTLADELDLIAGLADDRRLATAAATLRGGGTAAPGPRRKPGAASGVSAAGRRLR
jgi:hypothetical protein